MPISRWLGSVLVIRRHGAACCCVPSGAHVAHLHIEAFNSKAHRVPAGEDDDHGASARCPASKLIDSSDRMVSPSTWPKPKRWADSTPLIASPLRRRSAFGCASQAKRLATKANWWLLGQVFHVGSAHQRILHLRRNDGEIVGILCRQLQHALGSCEPFHIGAACLELFFQRFEAAVEMVDAVERGFAFRHQPGDDK